MPGCSLGVYDLRIDLDFSANPPAGGRYQDNSVLLVNAGIQSKFLVNTNDSVAIVVAGENIELNATINDIADLSRLSNITVELYFDWGGPLENLLQVSQSNSEGIVSFSALILRHCSWLLRTKILLLMI